MRIADVLRVTQFVHPSAILTILLVALTAVLQIVCLNRALVCADTVVVVPLFYAGELSRVGSGVAVAS
jgi:hypothetical protein